MMKRMFLRFMIYRHSIGGVYAKEPAAHEKWGKAHEKQCLG
jgi:hypothetical protein